MRKAIRNVLLVLLVACIVVGVAMPAFGIGMAFILFWLSVGAFYLLSQLAILLACVVWLALPLLVHKVISKLADLSPGPLLTALQWWVVSTYGLMGVLLVGMVVASWPVPKSVLWSVAENYHFLLWMGPMVAGLWPARAGFKRWYQINS